MQSEFIDLKDKNCLKKNHTFWTKGIQIEHSEWKQDWLTRQASTKVTMKTRLLPWISMRVVLIAFNVKKNVACDLLQKQLWKIQLFGLFKFSSNKLFLLVRCKRKKASLSIIDYFLGFLDEVGVDSTQCSEMIFLFKKCTSIFEHLLCQKVHENCNVCYTEKYTKLLCLVYFSVKQKVGNTDQSYFHCRLILLAIWFNGQFEQIKPYSNNVRQCRTLFRFLNA